MIKVKVVTNNNRGFLRTLFDTEFDNVLVEYNKDVLYEINSSTKNRISQIVKWHIFDYIGLFQVVNAKKVDADICFSYNRFLNTNKPYIILLENPSALVNYCWDRPKHFVSKLRLKRLFNDDCLKGIICMSKTCHNYLPNLYDIPRNLNVYDLYPLVEDDYDFTEDDIDKLVKANQINCLFVSSEFELKGGRDLLNVFEKIGHLTDKLKLTIITRQSTISSEDKLLLGKLKNVKVVEFNLTKKELNNYYKEASILVHPTRGDSFGLVTLEAVKYGCCVLATDMYAIKEVVRDEYNGYMGKSKYQVWDSDGTLNKFMRENLDKTVLNGEIDELLVEWIVEKLIMLEKDRSKLRRMCLNSLELARGPEFSATVIRKKFEDIILSMI